MRGKNPSNRSIVRLVTGNLMVFGDVVNTAQRLQSAARAGQIVVSEATYQKIQDSFNCERVGEVTLKNKAHPMIVYEVIE